MYSVNSCHDLVGKNTYQKVDTVLLNSNFSYKLYIGSTSWISVNNYIRLKILWWVADVLFLLPIATDVDEILVVKPH